MRKTKVHIIPYQNENCGTEHSRWAYCGIDTYNGYNFDTKEGVSEGIKIEVFKPEDICKSCLRVIRSRKVTVKFKVELTYFKQSGKYYSTASYTSQEEKLFKIFEEVREMKRIGKLPGLVSGCTEFLVLINVSNHPHNHPRLIL